MKQPVIWNIIFYPIGLILLFSSAHAEKYDSLDYYFIRGLTQQKFEQAHQYKDSLCKVAEEVSDPTGQLFCLILNGEIQMYQHYNYEKALNYYYDALALLEKNKKIDRKHYINIYTGIGGIHMVSGDIPESIEYYEKALVFSEKGNKYLYPELLSGLALTYSDQGDTAKGLLFQERLIHFLSNLSPKDYKKLLLAKFDYYTIINDPDSITYYGSKILNLSRNKFLNTSLTIRTGIAVLANGDTTRALALLDSSLYFASKIGYYPSITEACSLIQNIYLAQNNSIKALHYKMLSDSINRLKPSLNETKKLAKIESDFKQQKAVSSSKSRYKIFIYVITFIAILLVLSVMLFYKKWYSKKYIEQSIDTVQKFKINPQILERIEKKMQLFYSEEMYLDRNCSLPFVTEKLDIKNQRYLSEYVKIKFNKSFPSFVNDLRFEYLKNHMIADNSFEELTIDNIAFKLGFGSTRSFQNYIQNKTGMPPSKFLKGVS